MVDFKLGKEMAFEFFLKIKLATRKGGISVNNMLDSSVFLMDVFTYPSSLIMFG